MKLNYEAISGENRQWWNERGYILPEFDIESAAKKAETAPKWIHFGGGNIFRAFTGSVLQQLLDEGAEDTGLVVVEGFDYEIIDKIYQPHDNLTLLVTLKADGSIDKKVIASITKSMAMDRGRAEVYGELEEMFGNDSLQMASFTITEKGYWLTNASGQFMPAVLADFDKGPAAAESYIGKVAGLCYVRYMAGQKPLALVSMDNFSHNGDKLRESVMTFAEEWVKRGLVEGGFVDYLKDSSKISFPWSMIDKITPRPDESVAEMLKEEGFLSADAIITGKNTYVAPFVNAEEPQYLVIEDSFPAGRPALEKGGIIFTEKETVDKIEKMKVCTCLNPLHTALAVYGCLLGFTKISEEMKDETLKKLVFDIGYKEGLPVVVNPGIINPEDFIKEVLEVRIPNPFMPDTPQRIATDTSQKLPIRFGETIKAYLADEDKNLDDLKLIPLVLAGWVRYLMGVDDEGQEFTVSPDPLYDELKPFVDELKLGDKEGVAEKIRPILENQKIFGVDLYAIGLADKVISYFKELNGGKGAVRATLEKYVWA